MNPPTNASISFNKVIFALTFLSLLFSFINIIPFYPVFFILATAMTLLISPYWNLQRVNRVTFLVITISVFFLVSALLSGVPLNHIFNFYFLRRDGNFYISYLPFLVLPFVSVRARLYKYLLFFLYFQSFVALILILSVLVGRPIGGLEVSQGFVYHFLFLAHNAAGGYYMLITCLAFAIYWYDRGSFLKLAVLLINVLALILTGSRGSIIGLLAIPTAFMLDKSSGKYLFRLIFTISICVFMAFVLFFYSAWMEAGKNADRVSFVLPIERSHTLKIRVLGVWPRAIEDFLNSPIIGVGFSRYDDMPQTYVTIAPGIVFNKSPVYGHTDSHAHNTFLHLLSETGIVGLLLFIMMLQAMYQSGRHEPQPALRAFFIIGFWAIIFSGFTEHRIVTPSQMLPYNLMLVLSIMCRQSLEKDPNYIGQPA